VLKLRFYRDEHNNKVFTPDKYLTKEQVASTFSRLAGSKSKWQVENVESKPNEEPEEELDELAEEEPASYHEDNPIDEAVAETLGMIKSHFEISINDSVCLALENKKRKASRLEHLIGQVVAADMLEINFLSKTGSYYIWPERVSQFWISRDEVHLKLDEPDVDRRLHLVFSS